MNNNLEIKSVVKKYKSFTLDGISFTVPKGAVVGLIGENGAGKSTTINLLLNEIKADSGKINIFGKDHIQYEAENKEKIGFVFDEFNLPDMLNAKEVEGIMKNVYKKWDSKQFRKLLSEFNLPYDKPFNTFSKGMKVKFEFAIALSHNAEMLIFDEATSGLDPIMRNDILDMLKKFIAVKDRSILMSSHILSDLEKIADYIVFIHQGHIVFEEKKSVLEKEYYIIQTEKENEDKVNIESAIAKRYKKEKVSYLIRGERPKDNPGYTILNPDIESIMLFYVGGIKC